VSNIWLCTYSFKDHNTYLEISGRLQYINATSKLNSLVHLSTYIIDDQTGQSH
jgi:hypothetical protein